jgi:hypothetical protein
MKSINHVKEKSGANTWVWKQEYSFRKDFNPTLVLHLERNNNNEVIFDKKEEKMQFFVLG